MQETVKKGANPFYYYQIRTYFLYFLFKITLAYNFIPYYKIGNITK